MAIFASQRKQNRYERGTIIISNAQDYLVATGAEARAANEQSNERHKVSYVKLKDGDSLRGYLLVNVTTENQRGKDVYVADFKMFRQHGDFAKRIHSHSCLDPKNGVNCVSCAQGVGRTDVTIVPFYNVDTKTVQVFEAKKTHMKAIYGFIDLYGEDAPTTPIYFTRNGADKKTSYSISACPPNVLKKDGDAVWSRPDDVMDNIDANFIMDVINPPSEEYLRKLLGVDADDDDATITAIDGDAPTDLF